MAYTLARAITDPVLPVGVMLPVLARTLDPQIVRDHTDGWLARGVGQSWSEAYCPTKDGCRFGCKVYVRRAKGGAVQWAVHHSLTYGHSHSPTSR